MIMAKVRLDEGMGSLGSVTATATVLHAETEGAENSHGALTSVVRMQG